MSSNGARHSDVTKIALGWQDENKAWPNTAEEDAIDPSDPDGIQNIDEEPGESDNDDKDDGLLTYYFGDDEEATLEFAVTASQDSPQETYYLNVLFDWNKDGEWKGKSSNGASEWAVKNYKVQIKPGDVQTFRTDKFLTGTDVFPVWVRLTLSDKPIDESQYGEDGWDGTGDFQLGETEDYYLENQQVIRLLDESDKGLYGVPFNPFSPRPIPPFPPIGGGGNGGNNSCQYNYAMNKTLCKGKSSHYLLTIGGFAPDSISANSTNSSIASVSLNEANVTITAGDTEGSATITVIAKQGNCTYYLTITVNVKDCPPKKKLRIECCSPEEIKRDPSQCKNCKVVGRQMNQTNTHGGGGMVPETSMTGVKTNVSKSYVLTRGGGLVDVITVYYSCDPCQTELGQFSWEDIVEDYFSELDHMMFGGADNYIESYAEYDELTYYYDQYYDQAIYECATRLF